MTFFYILLLLFDNMESQKRYIVGKWKIYRQEVAK